MGGGIKEWPEDERPREKLQKQGAEVLTDAELLALVLRTGDAAAGKSAIDLGRDLLQAFDGDLRKLASATVTEACRVKGTGPAKAASVKAALELGKRFQSRRMETMERFTSPRQVFDYFHHAYRDARKEYFFVLLLDGKNRIIRKVPISEGSLNQSIVHPREVFNPAVRDSAAAVILIHNHPTGDPAPSREDTEITRRLKEAGDLLGIRVLDHIIIGDERYTSFADLGLM